jgi:hypothetical protein
MTDVQPDKPPRINPTNLNPIVPRTQGFLAYIHVKGERRRLGWFNTETKAVKAFNAAALEAFGDDARLLDLPTERGPQ